MNAFINPESDVTNWCKAYFVQHFVKLMVFVVETRSPDNDVIKCARYNRLHICIEISDLPDMCPIVPRQD